MKGIKSLTLLAQVATAAGPVNAKPGRAQSFSLTHIVYSGTRVSADLLACI